MEKEIKVIRIEDEEYYYDKDSRKGFSGKELKELFKMIINKKWLQRLEIASHTWGRSFIRKKKKKIEISILY